MVLNQGQFGYSSCRECLEIFLVFITGMCLGAIGIYWVEAKDVAKHSTIAGHSSVRRNYLAPTSVMLRV